MADALPAIAAGFLCRDHVVDAAVACCGELGVDGLTIRSLADRLGCAVGSIYRYFPDKVALLDAAGQSVLVRVADAASDMPLADSLSRYIRAANQHADLYRWLLASPQVPPVVDRIIDAWAGHLGDAATARRTWAIVHGLILLGEDEQSICKAVLS